MCEGANVSFGSSARRFTWNVFSSTSSTGTVNVAEMPLGVTSAPPHLQCAGAVDHAAVVSAAQASLGGVAVRQAMLGCPQGLQHIAYHDPPIR